MGIWWQDHSLTDDAMLDNFAKWVAEYKCKAVVSATDPIVLSRLAGTDSRFLWLESLNGYHQLRNVAAFSLLNTDGTLNLDTANDEAPLGIYICDVPTDATLELMVGDGFLCEGCEGAEEDGDPDCSVCEGEGGYAGSIHDNDIRGELLESLNAFGGEMPQGFVWIDQGGFNWACKTGIPDGVVLHEL